MNNRQRATMFTFPSLSLLLHSTSSLVGEPTLSHLSAVQLPGYGKPYPRDLLGGQQQRVALTRALASQPDALMLDEPFSALDTHLRHHIEKLLIATLENYQGVTLFVTHNQEEAYRVCQDLLVVDDGVILSHGNKHDIFEHPARVRVAQLTGCKNFSRAVAIDAHKVTAIEWGCTLNVIEPIPKSLSHVGIRAHQITFTEEPNQPNTFPCWLAATSETQHRITLYLKLNQPSTNAFDYHLQAEVFKEKWAIIKDRPFP